jgi:hypothetical protein
MADKGTGKKSKTAKVTLNVSTPSTLKNSLAFNFKNGLKYKGSLVLNQQRSNNLMFKNTIVTYQKGNTTYIIPYKHRVVMPEVKQGYTGLKLIIRQR